MPKIKYSLQKIINDTNFFSRKYLFWKMIKYVISALHFLHTIGINHGNIKPNNLLDNVPFTNFYSANYLFVINMRLTFFGSKEKSFF